MSDLVPFATKQDLANFWRELDSAEATRADSLLPLASNRLRLMARDVEVDLDDKIGGEEPDEIYKSNLQYVVLEAVKRALQTPQDTPPVDNYSQTAGPYSENYKLSNPSGDLWFKKSELTALGLYGRQTLGNITTTREDIYS